MRSLAKHMSKKRNASPNYATDITRLMSIICEALLAESASVDDVVDATQRQGLSAESWQSMIADMRDESIRRRAIRNAPPEVDPTMPPRFDVRRVIVNTLRQLETATAGEMCDALCGCDIDHQYVFQWLSHESVKPDGQVVALRVSKNGVSMNEYSVRV